MEPLFPVKPGLQIAAPSPFLAPGTRCQWPLPHLVTRNTALSLSKNSLEAEGSPMPLNRVKGAVQM